MDSYSLIPTSSSEDEISHAQSDVQEFTKIQHECLELFKKKNADYGRAFATFGIIGLLTRIEDKIMRALNISKNHIILCHEKSLKDTLTDLHNYSAMALMIMKENS